MRWRRLKPKPATTAAERHALQCAAGPGHRKKIWRTWKRERLRFGRYRELRQIAPYPGGGTYWAVPYAIVFCESRGLWSAYNPSGAAGPYQLLGHGAPYPADTWREKMANHRIAAELYAGGAGASAWVCA